jgi:hypothetical protein
VPKAVDYLGRAGAKAVEQIAHSEAIGYFTRALELLRQLPEGETRDRQELDLQIALNWSLYMARGPRASAERESAVSRARELCEQLGENDRLVDVLLALSQLRFNRHDFVLARELAEKVLSIAPKAEGATIAAAHTLLGVVGFSIGELPVARGHFELASELFALGFSTGGRPFLSSVAQVAPNILTSTLGNLGYPLTAFNRAQEFLTATRRSSDPISISGGLMTVLMHQLRFGDTRLVAERADEMFSIATAH